METESHFREEEEVMDDRPPGYRFYPTEEELIVFYLHNKLEGTRHDIERVIPLVDIYEFNPWHLPDVSGKLCHGDPEQWFFFTPRQQRETHGGRPSRTTSSGYWKATGSPRYVFSSSNRVIGLKKTMVFYKGRAPSGRKTKWKMNEYRATEVEYSTTSSSATPKLRHEFSLCRVYIKSGCLRAFDRRPSEDTTSETISHRNNVDCVATLHQSPPMVENTNSWDSSSSGDHTRLSQAGEDSNWEMAEDDLHLLWKWELNWFQGIPEFLDP